MHQRSLYLLQLLGCNFPYMEEYTLKGSTKVVLSKVYLLFMVVLTLFIVLQ